MSAAQVRDAEALPRLVIDNATISLGSIKQPSKLIERLSNPASLDDFEKRVDFACAAQPIFQKMIDALESEANDIATPLDPDGSTVDRLERDEERMKEIRRGVNELITDQLGNDMRSDVEQRILNQLLRFEKSFQPFITNLQRYRWLVLSVDGGLAKPTGRLFDNAEEFVEALFQED